MIVALVTEILQAFHKAQNALTQERRTASQLRGRVNQLEFDLATQQTILNEKVVQCKTLEDSNKKLVTFLSDETKCHNLTLTGIESQAVGQIEQEFGQCIEGHC